ncbi:cupin domain-containing protein [Actinomarinicola tropica]|uniref:Cupin domain-containing protein n=1 Tax=Actinomarinicola tropica TaxID=2789776 RepID=A0A5Q2RGC7_9ACTN|nr:cupin domain-containing protein [Actinomarinicola tropica]QGG93661.1 cupin domain-containing protein [Actinomarinicola tropica]
MSAASQDLLAGWSIGRSADVEWVPWGSGGSAWAKVLASGDGYHLALVEATPGYRGDRHVHDHTEMLHVVAGEVETNGEVLGPGDGYVAEAGSEHVTFSSPGGATYLSIFRL